MVFVKALSDSEVTSQLKDLPNWELRDGRLRREFTFKDFPTAFAFMTTSALAAERLNHHPDWCNSYNRVLVNLRTHDADGITENDFALARAMNDYQS